MPNMNPESNPPHPDAPEAMISCAERVLESRDLLDGRIEVVIRHEGRFYRLRRTRLGKLILTA